MLVLCQALCVNTSAFNLPNNQVGSGGVGVDPIVLPLYRGSVRPRDLPKASGVSNGTMWI